MFFLKGNLGAGKTTFAKSYIQSLFELNKTSINDLFRSQEEFLTSAKNLVDATVEKNLSFYRLAAKFGTLLNLFELRT